MSVKNGPAVVYFSSGLQCNIYRVLRKFEDIIQKYPEYLKR